MVNPCVFFGNQVKEVRGKGICTKPVIFEILSGTCLLISKDSISGVVKSFRIL